MASAPNGEGSATVDGDTGDWSLGDDFFADMTDAARDAMPVRAKFYPSTTATRTLYALVLAQGDEQVRQDRTDEAYVSIDGTKLIDSTHGPGLRVGQR